MFKSCYYKYLKMFFDYERMYNVSAIFLTLQLPSIEGVLASVG